MTFSRHTIQQVLTLICVLIAFGLLLRFMLLHSLNMPDSASPVAEVVPTPTDSMLVTVTGTPPATPGPGAALLPTHAYRPPAAIEFDPQEIAPSATPSPLPASPSPASPALPAPVPPANPGAVPPAPVATAAPLLITSTSLPDSEPGSTIEDVPTPTPTIFLTPTTRPRIINNQIEPPWWPCEQGQIKGLEKLNIYYVEEHAGYTRTFIGIVCFNTEEDAQAAGYRRAE